jgi:hypothetical protein
MQHFTGFDLSNSSLYLSENRPVEFQFVLGDMNDHQPEAESPEILLVLKSTVDCHQCVEPILKQLNQMIVLEPLPAHIRCRLDFVSRKSFDDPGIHAGIH